MSLEVVDFAYHTRQVTKQPPRFAFHRWDSIFLRFFVSVVSSIGEALSTENHYMRLSFSRQSLMRIESTITSTSIFEIATKTHNEIPSSLSFSTNPILVTSLIYRSHLAIGCDSDMLQGFDSVSFEHGVGGSLEQFSASCLSDSIMTTDWVLGGF